MQEINKYHNKAWAHFINQNKCQLKTMSDANKFVINVQVTNRLGGLGETIKKNMDMQKNKELWRQSLSTLYQSWQTLI